MSPTRRPSTWIAAGLLAFCLAMIAFSLASAVLPDRSLLPDDPVGVADFLAVCSVFVALPTVGAILAILRPGNPIGWLFLLCGVGFVFSIFTTEYVGRGLFTDADLPGVGLVDWVGNWIGLASISLALVWIPLLFPDGHLPGPGWRPIAWFAGVWLAISTVSLAIVPDAAHGYEAQLANPFGVTGPLGEVASLIAGLNFPVTIILGVLALVSVVLRFIRSRGVERQQLKWFLFAVAVFVAAFLVAVTTQSNAVWYLVLFGLASLPIAAAVAILRYRLYDIDRLVSRSIAYAVLTGGLIVTFLVVNLALTTTFSTATNVDSASVAAATLIVAVLFTPLRRRVQRAVDRRFDRARYNAEQTALAFSTRLRDEVELPAVTADLDATVRAAMAPTTVDVWLRGVAR